MKNRNKIASLIIASGLILVSSQSCQKYPDGPLIDFRPRKERVANDWRVDNLKINGSDYTSLVTDYYETFTTDGNYSYNWGILSGVGTWTFQNNFKEIKIMDSNSQSTEVLFIQKLEEKQFWYYYMDGNDKKVFHMNQK
ncbi:MAG: hypothetical protein WCK02_14995 [Bacteroidota bacterium]